jgi:NADH dehydrogenase
MVAAMNVIRQHVVIVGGGFGGLSTAHAVARVAVDVTVIDRHNYHLFQPLLYQVATAALAPNTIAAPIRAILRAQKNATVLMETVTGIEMAGRAVLIGERRMPSAAAQILMVGDTCLSKSWDGKPVPGIAPAAKQMGAPLGVVARWIFHARAA